VVPFESLGLPTPFELTGISASTSLFLPVPDGLSLSALTGRLVAAAGTPSGDVVFSSQGHRLAVASVSADATMGQPFSVPLGSVAAVDGVVRVDVQSALPLADRFCQGAFILPEVDLDALAVTYAGQASPPVTIGQFLPPFLDRLRVWVPANPSAAVDEAAIEVADEVVARYGAQPIRVEVKALGADLPDPGMFDQTTRDVVLTGVTGTPGARLAAAASGAPLLVVSGDGDTLRHQTDIVVGQLVRLVAAQAVTASGQFIPTRIPALEQPFTALGLATLALHGEGPLRFVVNFAQADFGLMIDRVHLHVAGTYTPVPSGAAASLDVFFDDQLVASKIADRSGAFQVDPMIPAAHLRRDNTVEVRFQYIPADGLCTRAAVPVDVQLSALASVESRGGVSLPVGFQRLPQALLPASDCVLDVSNPGRLATAVQLFSALQRLSRLPLVPRVVPLSQVVSSVRPAVIITADPSALRVLHPTIDLSAPAPNLKVATAPAQINLGAAPAVGQVFENRGRQILAIVARPEASASLSGLVAALTAPSQLQGLAHDVALVEPGGHVDDIAVHDVLNPPAVSSATTPNAVRWWEWAAIVAVPLLALAAGWRLWQLVRLVRLRRGGQGR
jgi:hypothetical protein